MNRWIENVYWSLGIYIHGMFFSILTQDSAGNFHLMANLREIPFETDTLSYYSEMLTFLLTVFQEVLETFRRTLP